MSFYFLFFLQHTPFPSTAVPQLTNVRSSRKRSDCFALLHSGLGSISLEKFIFPSIKSYPYFTFSSSPKIAIFTIFHYNLFCEGTFFSPNFLMELQTSYPSDKAFTVSQLTSLIKDLLENTFQTVQLKGEISNFKHHSSGHFYFSLKDSVSQINAVMFRGRNQYLNFTPRDGMIVLVSGQITVYPKTGSYQINVTKMTQAGVGQIMEMIEMRKRKLAEEGLFATERKRPLPRFPQTIGVVTSPTGAAIRDILNVTKMRNPKMNVTIFPCLVQGTAAAKSIVKMIQIANKYKMCDILIVGRGGGSIEDLLPFSDEEVVRQIAASEIPVISAVGHEIDFALSDFASDVRASTPSQAAEIAVPRLSDIMNQIALYKSDFCDEINEHLEKYRIMMNMFKAEHMKEEFRKILYPLLQRLDYAKENLFANMQILLEKKRQSINEKVTIFENANPQAIFDRGYSMVSDQNGNVIRNTKNLSPGDKIFIRPAKGFIEGEILKVKEKL